MDNKDEQLSKDKEDELLLWHYHYQQEQELYEFYNNFINEE